MVRNNINVSYENKPVNIGNLPGSKEAIDANRKQNIPNYSYTPGAPNPSPSVPLNLGGFQNTTPTAAPNTNKYSSDIPSYYTDVKTGTISGVEKNGNTYLGNISPEEAQNIVNIENAKRAVPEGANLISAQAEA